MYNNISFTSTIRPVTVPQYKQEVLAFEKPCVAKFPWTINEAVIGENVVTTNVMDCSVCGIKVKDKVFLLHTTPFHELNKDFAKIEAIIKENVDLKTDDIQAILPIHMDLKAINILKNTRHFYKNIIFRTQN